MRLLALELGVEPAAVAKLGLSTATGVGRLNDECLMTND